MGSWVCGLFGDGNEAGPGNTVCGLVLVACVVVSAEHGGSSAVYGCACVPLRGNPPASSRTTIHQPYSNKSTFAATVVVVSNSPGPRIKAHTSDLSTKSVATLWSLALVALVPGRARDDEPVD